MTIPYLTIAFLTAIGAPAPDANVQCPVPVQGTTLTCCTTGSGQACCAQTVTNAGLPFGCSCAP